MTQEEILEFLHLRCVVKGPKDFNNESLLVDLCVDLLAEVEFQSMMNDFRVAGGELNPLAGTTFGRLGPPTSSRTEES